MGGAADHSEDEARDQYDDMSYVRLYQITLCAKRLVDWDVMPVCPQCGHRDPHSYCVKERSDFTGELEDIQQPTCEHPYHELVKELRLAMPHSESLKWREQT